MSYVIGIDGGTESVRAFVFDLDGRPKGIGVVPYPTAFPEPAQAEQNPDDWWQAAGEATQRALQAAAPDFDLDGCQGCGRSRRRCRNRRPGPALELGRQRAGLRRMDDSQGALDKATSAGDLRKGSRHLRVS